MKRSLLTLISTMFVIMVAACGGNKIDDEIAAKFTSQAEKTIQLLNENNYEEVHMMFTDEMKTELPVDDMEAFTPILDGVGQFEEIEKPSIEKQDDFYVTVTTAKYSDGKLIFTVTFNENEEIAGLFVK